MYSVLQMIYSTTKIADLWPNFPGFQPKPGIEGPLWSGK